MKATTHAHTPSLFDELQAEAVTDDIGNTEAESADAELLEDWHEVSQARFLSWSEKMQLHYCWRRDLDAALRAEELDANFYLARAALYKQDFDACAAQG